MKALLLAGVTALALTQVAAAQSPNQQMNQPTPSTQTASAASNLRAQVQTNLKDAGFTDIKVIPESFVVHAKDKSGNPVMMFITPDSMSQVTEIKTNRSSSTDGSNAAAPATTAPSSKAAPSASTKMGSPQAGSPGGTPGK